MAIAYGNGQVLASSASFTGPTISGSNTLGYLFVIGDTAADDITGITWGGVSMAKIDAVKIPSDRWLGAWILYNPASAASIVLTGGSFFNVSVDYLTGAQQSNTADSHSTNTATAANSFGLTTNVVNGNSWLLYMAQTSSGNKTWTTSFGTMRKNSDSGGSTGPAYGDSNTVVGGAGNVTVTMTPSSNATMAGIVMSIAPASGGGSTVPLMALMGVGV